MFLGHFAVGFAAKRVAPQVSLGTMFLAAQLADLVWPVLVLGGLEQVAIRPGITAVTPLEFLHYPYSHSLVALALWAALLAAIHAAATGRVTARTAAILALVVLSHWVLDVASHRPDMPVTLTGPQRLGLGLWDSIPATLAVESGLFAAGVFLYARGTRARDRVGSYALWFLVAFLALVYVANFLGPPPPSPQAVAGAGLAMGLLVGWAYWVDAHRDLKGAAE